ncbi:MAG: DUF4445 domain-containing protein [Nitrospirae bacterium]|nr:DUF4445 domain-containing protein [Nitrospirota bacterium]
MKSMVEKIRLSPEPGGMADAGKIRNILAAAGFERVNIPLRTLRALPVRLKRQGYIDAVLVAGNDEWRLVDISGIAPLAVAVDLGSTNIVGALVNPSDGEVLGEKSVVNPQTNFSEDILDRILYSDTKMHELHPPLINSINALVESLCADAGSSPADVALMTVAGNTAMGHLFLGIEATSLPVMPNNPVVHDPGFFTAGELGIRIHDEGMVYLLPNVGAFVGGDVVADILVSGMHRSEAVRMLIDVGTNVEIAVGNADFLLVGAGAAGPALEGGIVGHGGRATLGAIERVGFNKLAATLEYSTVGGGRPTRICGSGLIDLMAVMFENGLIDGKGRFNPERAAVIDRGDDGPAVVIAPASGSATGQDIVITEKDLDNLITSKAGMYALIHTLTGHLGIGIDDIETIYVCGAFGSYIDPRSAMAIGMLPVIQIDKFRPLGNSSLKGAAAIISDVSLLAELHGITGRVTYIDINTDPLFMRELPGALFIPHTDVERFEPKRP